MIGSLLRQERGLSPECRAVQRRLVFLEELSAAEATTLLAHLGVCGNCRRIERLLHGLLAVLYEVPVSEPGDPYWERQAETILARVRAEQI